MKIFNITFLVIIFAIAAITAWFFFLRPPSLAQPDSVSSFEECEAAGYPTAESYPRQCWDNKGNHFVENVTATWEATYTNASDDMIKNVNIKAGDTVSSPLSISGEARGYWFFEASFPVVLTDWDGKIIAEGYATAGDDWMVEDFVPFSATLDFEVPAGSGGLINRGSLILKRDNPSGLPENDAALEIPIVFE